MKKVLFSVLLCILLGCSVWRESLTYANQIDIRLSLEIIQAHQFENWREWGNQSIPNLNYSKWTINKPNYAKLFQKKFRVLQCGKQEIGKMCLYELESLAGNTISQGLLEFLITRILF